MTREECRVLEFIEEFHHILLENGDIGLAGQMLEDDVEWIGAGKQEIRIGRDETIRFLRQEIKAPESTCRLLKTEYRQTKLAEGIYTFSGSCFLRQQLDDVTVFENEMRVTGFCRLHEDGIRIAKAHYSYSRLMQGEQVYQQLIAEESTRVLRELIGKQSKELEEKNSNLDALIQNIPGGVICCNYDEYLELVYYSDRFLQMFGYTREEIEVLFHNQFSRMIMPEDLKSTWDEVIRQLKYGNTKEIEYRVICRDGSYMVIQDRGQLVKRDGKTMFYCILLDVTDRRRADEELKLSLERYQIVFNQTTDIVFEWDMVKDTLLYSPNWMKKFGYTPLRDCISQVAARSKHIFPEDVELFGQVQKDLLAGMPYGEIEIRISNKDGAYRWCRIHTTLQTDKAGRSVRSIGLIKDIDKEKRETDRLRERAEQDSLTGIYNRGAVQALIQRYVVKSGPDDMCALLVLDVDNFKKINDVYGHLSGDVMLKDIADMLKKLMPEHSTIGRVGGDEFAILMRHVKSVQEVSEKAEQILEAFRHILPDDEDAVSCSVGIAMAPEDGDDFTQIYKKADVALYRAKRRGKNQYAFYEATYQHGIEQSVVPVYKEAEEESPYRTLALYTFDILCHSNNMEQSVDQIMEIVGRQMKVSRVYIFEDSPDGAFSTNTFEWCNDGIQSQKENLKRVYLEALDNYYDNFNEDGMFYCKDVKELMTHQRRLLEEQGIKSVLQCLIVDGGKSRGFIGFDDCSGPHYWTQSQINVLQMISKIVGMFLLKGRVETNFSKLKESFRLVVERLDNWLYVLEPDTYRFLFFNRRTADSIPGVKLGGICYKIFFGLDQPCEGCPISFLNEERISATHMIWNGQIGQFVYSRAQKAIWQDGQEAYIVDCCSISEMEGYDGFSKHNREEENQ